jgi:D-alanyl-D-alanine carboxypeptidase (penicillin-binding protein 5/6)
MRIHTALRFLAFLICVAPLGLPAQAQLLDTKAKQAFMIDASTGTVLFEKNADEPVPPASLAKLMTMEVVFQALKTGRRVGSETFPVSENAWRTGGAPSGTSTMFAALKSQVPIIDLVRGTIIQSANDACIILAEGFSGSEQAFTEQMNERAAAIGLKGSRFKNSSGLPAEGQWVTMRDLVTLASHIRRNYPELYQIYSEPEFTWNKITQRNRNPLLALDIGVDGMSTGYTEESGYAIVASAQKNGMRLFMAMGGLSSEKERAEEARKMIEWGQNSFAQQVLFKAGDVMGDASVFGGASLSVPVGSPNEVSVLVTAQNPLRLRASVVYKGPLIAPVKTGQEIGELRVYSGETLIQVSPVSALADVEAGSLTERAISGLKELATGWVRGF